MRFALADTNAADAGAGAPDPDEDEDTGGTSDPESRTTPAQGSPGPDASSSEVAELRRKAERHFQAGRHVQAAVAYEAAIGLDGNEASLYAGLGDARSEMGNETGAVQAYRTAVRLAPENAGHYVALGDALLEVGDREGAIAAFRHALRIDPGTSRAREQLASLDARVPGGAGRNNARSAQGSGLPYKPSRSAIVEAMRPLETAVEACKPGHQGRVVFRVVVEGKTGTVQKVKLEGPLGETAKGGCMESVIHSASFPRFRKETLEIEYPFVL